jgi:glycosyltransferase involved in cell wall biosynthesis
LSIQKGLPDLLQAWKHLNPKEAELVLAGVILTEEKSIIEPLLHSNERVTWNGHCDNVPQLLETCDALILPSAQDGFGLVVLEAMAAGLPVIVSDRVGAKDCVDEEKNGFIFEFGNQNRLEERMEWFLQDASRAREMRPSAHQAAEKYSWESYGHRLVSLFKD